MKAPESKNMNAWWLGLSAAGILAITMGLRQSTGLFMSPINTQTGLGIAVISFALAIGQLMWGAVQPVAGALAGRYGHYPVMVTGILLLAVGSALAPFSTSTFALVVTLGILSAGGSGMASFSVLMGAVAYRLPPERRSFASGFINAGGSFGQFIFAPLTAALIAGLGWMHAFWAMACLTLFAIPMLTIFRSGHGTTMPASSPGIGLRQQLRVALADPSYLYLHLGFFTCGFHIAFLVTHLPGEVQLCGLSPAVSANSLAIIGLFNIAGSLSAGWLGGKFRMKYLLALMYSTRAIAIAIYLVSPKTPATLYLFAAMLGLTWLATVPPTAGLVGKLFGVKHLATLFGLTLLSHQIGGFLGAWLGGLVITSQGDYMLMWHADIALAVFAALINLPIREPRTLKTAPA